MDPFKEKLELQKLTSALSATFNKVEAKNIDELINTTIFSLASQLNADSCKLYIKDKLNKYEYYKEGTHLSKVFIPKLQQSTKWVSLERDVNKDYGSVILKVDKSTGLYPESIDNEIYYVSMRISLYSRSGDEGLLAFDSFSENNWDYDYVPLLRTVGETILNTLDLIKTESHLKLSEKKYQDLVEMSMGLIYKCNDKSEFTFLNPAWQKLLGHKIEDMIGKSFIEFMPERMNLRDLKTHKSIYNGNPVSEYETIFLTIDGEEKTIVFTGIPEYDSAGKIIGTQGTGFDITDRKRMENEIINSRNKLRSLALELSQNEQNQNKRLASIIHDSMGQEIAMLKVSLGQLTTMELSEDAQRIVSDTRERLGCLLDITRDVIQNLYPPVLNEMGLISAIEWLGTRFVNDHDVEFNLTYIDLHFEFKEDVSQTLFLIVKELIVNAIKHANASMLIIRVDCNPEMFRMSVFDNGKGFSNNPCKFKKCGLGLINTRERIENLNGKLVINKIKKGTEVEIILPLDEELIVCT